MFNQEELSIITPEELENNQNQPDPLWANSQTVFDAISLIMTNGNSNVPNNLTLAQNILNPIPDQLSIENSEETIQDVKKNNNSITKQKDIVLIKRASILNQNKNFLQRKRNRNNIKKNIDTMNEMNLEKENENNYYLNKRQIENNITLEHSSYRPKSGENNIDKKRFRYKIKKLRKKFSKLDN